MSKVLIVMLEGAGDGAGSDAMRARLVQQIQHQNRWADEPGRFQFSPARLPVILDYYRMDRKMV